MSIALVKDEAARPSHAPPPLLESSEPSTFFEIDARLRAAGSEDGVVLLDLSSGEYHSLDPVAARVFLALAEGRSREAALDQLDALFDAPRQAIERDVDSLLQSFEAAGFIRRCARAPRQLPDIAATRPGKHPAAFPTVRMSPRVGARGAWPSFVWLWRGLVTLASVDWLTRRSGFPGIARRLASIGAAEPKPIDDRVWQIVAGINRAASLYYQRRWCLQRSAACADLLRRQGFAAELVLGVQVMPFIAHAWVEIDGEVVNDNPELTRSFTVLHRL